MYFLRNIFCRFDSLSIDWGRLHQSVLTPVIFSDTPPFPSGSHRCTIAGRSVCRGRNDTLPQKALACSAAGGQSILKKRWQEGIPLLNVRKKWHRTKRNISTSDIVLVIEDIHEGVKQQPPTSAARVGAFHS